MSKYYRNRLPVRTEGKEGAVVGGTYQGFNYIAVKAPEGWIISPAFILKSDGFTMKFPKGGAYVFRNAWDEKVVTINDKGLEVHISS